MTNPNRFFLIVSLLICGLRLHAQDKLSNILKDELQREFTQLKSLDKSVYYMSYRVDDMLSYRIRADFGVINSIDSSRVRVLTPVVRVGSYQFDNTHHTQFGGMPAILPLSEREDLIRLALWKSTDMAYKNAVQTYERLLTDKKVRVAEEDTAADFSLAKKEVYFDPPVNYKSLKPDFQEQAENLKAYTAILKQNPDLLAGSGSFEMKLTRKYFVDTEGTEIVENGTGAWLSVFGSSKAEDGMELPLYKLYFAYTPEGLPSRDSVLAELTTMSDKLSLLRKAPIADPFVGPAILSGRAAGVFFHEIFGHRLEGKRMKNEADGQTFKNKIGTAVLPEFLSMKMDPTVKTRGSVWLNGSYRFDDEGVAAQEVTVVENGILKSFLMTRTPINGASGSNGHARTAPGGVPESRQSNLIVEGKNGISLAALKARLIEECKKQGKAYGYLFQDVEGGFTNVGRTVPNAFNVLPTEVYRIYADGSRDELVRGVDLIGTPLSMFRHIAACSDDVETFNGMCGSGSGWVPVSASSPAIFVDVIETQKKSKSQERMPVLPRPDLEIQFNSANHTMSQEK